MMRTPARVVLALAIACLVHATAFAQGSTTTATLSGVVQDTTGAVVPGATIVVKNVATGVTNETVSNQSGAFSVPALVTGTYQATVSLSGFKTFQIDRIVLTPGDTASVIAKLEIGAATETITVQAHSDLVDTTSTTVSSTLTSDQIQDLPLVTKNAMQIVTLLPGINANSTHVQRNSTAMGLPQSAISIMIDGVNIQDQSVKSTDGFYADIRPQTDLVEEVTVSEATSTADSSGQGAVQIKFVTRSGSNTPNGSAYEYLRDTRLDSNSWANESKGLPTNPVNWNQFGFRQGGPIVVPGLYDGHNRAFYFVNYEEFRLPVTASTTRTLLTPSAQNGVFKYGCTASGGCGGSVDLLALAARNGQTSTVDPTIALMLNDISQSVATQGALQAAVDQNIRSFTWQPQLFRAEHLPGGRIDFNINDKERLSGTSVYQKVNSDPDIVNNGYPSYPGFAVDSTQYSFRYTGTAGLRSTLTKNLVNDFGYGLVWSPVYFSANVTPDRYVAGINLGFPQVPSGTNLSAFNVTAGSQSRNGSNYNFHDNLSWLKGAHSLTMGGVYTKVTDNELSHSIVPGYLIGLDTASDPANAMFTAANFPGSTSTDLASARNLYALLTGRITQITGNSVLQPNGTYLYRGDPNETIDQKEMGLFAQDQWRLKPNFTVNAGLRYELQFPIEAAASLYSKNTIADVCGRAGSGAAAQNAPSAVIGCPFGQPGIALNGPSPTYKQYSAGSPGYNLDTNNFAPSVGVAWQPNVESGLLHTILGDPQLATIRASYGRAYNEPGTADYLATLRAGPGLQVNTNRNVANQNLYLPGDAGSPLLLSQSGRLVAPPNCATGQTVGCVPTGESFPQSINFATGIDAFDPNYQTSYTDSWSAGFQRAIGKDTSFEIRYIGNRTSGISSNENYNEMDIYNAGFGSSSSFIDEFKKAQKNLAANVAAGKGATFAYTGIAGTSPLPIFLASYTGQGVAASTDPTKYSGTQWTNTAILPSFSMLTPNIFTFFPASTASTFGTNGLYGNPTFRANGVAAGLPANFWVLNPDVSNDIVRATNGYQKYHTIQLVVNRRLSQGLSFTANYAYQVQFGSSLDTLFRDRADLRSTASPPHAFKVATNYELPFGRDHRFGANMPAWAEALAGNWQVNLTGRAETGRLFDIGDVRLVNLSMKDLQKEFRYYTNSDGFVYDLPQALIANTVKAYAIDVTSPTGHPLCTGSNASTCGGPDPTQPYLAPASSASCTTIISGDCNVRQQLLKAPLFTRFDFSAKKRVPFSGHASFDFEFDVLNVFNAIDFNAVFPTGGAPGIANAALGTPDNYRVTTAYADFNNTYDPGGRIGQLVFRVNW